MTKRFIIALDKSTKAQNKELVSYFKQKKFAYWHWISNLWLITTDNEEVTPTSLRTAFREIMPNEYMMIFEVNNSGNKWAGFGPSGEKKNMFRWLKNTWDKVGSNDKPLREDSDMDSEEESN